MVVGRSKGDGDSTDARAAVEQRETQQVVHILESKLKMVDEISIHMSGDLLKENGNKKSKTNLAELVFNQFKQETQLNGPTFTTLPHVFVVRELLDYTGRVYNKNI